MFNRISINPEVCHGKPVIQGTRILVSNVLSALAAGDTIDEIIEEYHVSKEDIYAALAFSSELLNYESHTYEERVS